MTKMVLELFVKYKREHPTKKLMTDKEVKEGIKKHIAYQKAYNSGNKMTEEDWQEAHRKAVEDDGYKDELCSCGVAFLAFIHFTRCKHERCPFSTGKSLLDMMGEDIKKEEQEIGND